MKIKDSLLAVIIILLAVPAFAQQGDKENGKKIYEKRCWWCHGEGGAGDGPATQFLNPPPRDFTSGMYKFKTTPFDEIVPADEDLFLMIKGEKPTEHITGWTGMNDSSMPGWGDMIKDQEIWDLIAYIKTFAGLGNPSKPPIQIPSGKADIEKGKELFNDRCVECHGEEGKGDATKMLKDDFGNRTWPRNLTKPWSFRMSNDPKDIYTRITVGIPGTQMPSFADPSSKKKMTDEERWYVANYVAGLADPVKKPKDDTVLKAVRVEGELPTAVDDPKWQGAEPTSYYLVPQIIAEERWFTPSLNSITVRALYNNKDIAILLEWNDRTKSIPGDEKAGEVAGGEVFEDGVAIQLPIQMPEGGKKPYFVMGDSKLPVNIWLWKSEKVGASPTVKLINASGVDKLEERDITKGGLTANSAYNKGTWRVLMKRPLVTQEKDKDFQFEEGRFIPIAFAVWDGSNGEKGSKHTMTTWYWLFIKPPTGMKVYLIPIIVAIVIFGGELFLVRKKEG